MNTKLYVTLWKRLDTHFRLVMLWVSFENI